MKRSSLVPLPSGPTIESNPRESRPKVNFGRRDTLVGAQKSSKQERYPSTLVPVSFLEPTIWVSYTRDGQRKPCLG